MSAVTGRRSVGQAAAVPPARPDAGPPPATSPVLLLHGQPGGSRDWNAVRAALGDDAIVVTLDRPGWDGRTSAGGLAENAAAALAALDRGGVERAVIVGHSFGAAVAGWIAAVHPERAGGLVLVAPAANLASLFPIDRWLALPLAGYVTSASLLASAGVTLASAHARKWIAGQLALDERLLRDAGRALRSPSAWRAFAVEQRALIRDLPELESELHRITAPTTVVIGTADRIVPPSSARLLATQIPGASLVEVEGGNHLLPLQHPDRVADVIAASL
jgi:pimeloyl-ACP methyl ester carboxylesterase